jgi:hypothetical protein
MGEEWRVYTGSVLKKVSSVIYRCGIYYHLASPCKVVEFVAWVERLFAKPGDTTLKYANIVDDSHYKMRESFFDLGDGRFT